MEKSEEMMEKDASMKDETMKDEMKDEAMADDGMEKTEMAAAEGDKAMMAPEGGMHEVMAGDNLWDIAKEMYGDGTKWMMIMDANPGINPKNLKIGSKLTVPAAQ